MAINHLYILDKGDSTNDKRVGVYANDGHVWLNASDTVRVVFDILTNPLMEDIADAVNEKLKIAERTN